MMLYIFTKSLNLYALWIVLCPFVLFLFVIVLSVLFRFTDSDYTCGIFKLFFSEKYFIHGENRLANSK